MDAHSERGWFWLVCASPEGRAIEIPEERLILYYMRICDVVAEGLRNGVRARVGTHSKSVETNRVWTSADRLTTDQKARMRKRKTLAKAMRRAA